MIKVRRITRKNLVKALRKEYGKFDTVYFDWNWSSSVKELSDDELYDFILGKNKHLYKHIFVSCQYQGIGNKILYVSRKPIVFKEKNIYSSDTARDSNGSLYLFDKEYKELVFESSLGIVIKEEDNCYLYDGYMAHSRKSF